MRELATIREVSNIFPIEGADRIEVAQVDGWQCVVQKGEFAVGQQIVYVEVDSIMPEKPEYEFLRQRKFRVRTIKLRGQVSQGLVLPLSVLPSGKRYALGDDVTDVLGIKKYDPQAAQEEKLLKSQQPQHGKFYTYMMRFKWFRKLFGKTKQQKAVFPSWIVKTDEERIQNCTAMFQREKAAGTLFTATEKIDGQSGTFYLEKTGARKYRFGVCSRNIGLGKPDGSSYWTVAQNLELEKVLRALIGKADRIVLQGEITGPGIQKNKYDLKEYDFHAFNLIYPNRKVTTQEMTEMLKPFGIKTVPIVAENVPLTGEIADMVEFSKGKSVVNPKIKREGVVMRNYDRDISFKIINPDFLLANDE